MIIDHEREGFRHIGLPGFQAPKDLFEPELNADLGA